MHMSRRSVFFDVLFCSLLALPATFSLWGMAGFPASWDFGAHIVTNSKLVFWLERGVYPLQFPEFLFGGGILLFYSPLFFIFSAFLAFILGLDVLLATKVTLILAFELAALTTYFVCRKIFNSRQGAVVSSVGFTYAGFHVVNVLSQGMYPAALAFVFLPIVFGYQYLSVRENKPSFALYSGIALGLMILSHMLTAYVTVMFLIIFCLFQALVNIKVRSLAIRVIFFLGISLVSSLGVSGWFLIPYVQYVFGTFLNNGVIEGFTSDPRVFASRVVPISLFFVRNPPEFAAETRIMPLYIGSVLTVLTVLAVFLLFRRLRSTAIMDYRSPNQFAFLMIAVFLLSLFFSTELEWITIVPSFLVRYLLLTQFPARAAFLPSFAAAVLAGYSMSRISHYFSLKNLGDRLNLDFNPSVLLALAICILLMLDSSVYFLAPSPYHYQATYPPYGSSSLELSYEWVSQQKGYFRVIDPLGGPYVRIMLWDDLMMLGTMGDPNFIPFSQDTLRAWNFVSVSDDTVNDIKLKGYFGVKYGIGHVQDPAKDQQFGGTDWVPVATFHEITVFENPYFRPLAEVVANVDSPNSTGIGSSEITWFDANRIDLVTTTSQDGFLLVKWFNGPQWHDRLDGNPTQIFENMWGFMYIKLPQGNHRVEFTYAEATAVFIGLYLVSLGTATVLAVLYRFRKLHNNEATQSIE